jgi:hypothetical protein
MGSDGMLTRAVRMCQSTTPVMRHAAGIQRVRLMIHFEVVNAAFEIGEIDRFGEVSVAFTFFRSHEQCVQSVGKVSKHDELQSLARRVANLRSGSSQWLRRAALSGCDSQCRSSMERIVGTQNEVKMRIA